MYATETPNRLRTLPVVIYICRIFPECMNTVVVEQMCFSSFFVYALYLIVILDRKSVV